MRDLARAATEELIGHILPFWSSLGDPAYGGMYGEVSDDLVVNRTADKGAVLTCRSLWTFSSAYRTVGTARYLGHATGLFRFVADRLIDAEHGGVFWSVDHQGRPARQGKHIYAQAFAIYSLSEYFRAAGDPRAMELAMALFYLIERRGFDPVANAYLEQFDREWNEVPNEYLSENNTLASFTMNTHLHVLEAYTNLYRAQPAPEVRQRIENLLETFHERIYDPSVHACRVFFDKRWDSLLDMRSFGHDIEASWLIDDAMLATGLSRPEWSTMVVDLATGVAVNGIQEDGSLAHERVAGHTDRTRIWWVQAEAIVGFLNAHARTGEDRFAALARGVWDFTRTHLVDTRPSGEWFHSISPDGTLVRQLVAGPWKCPYHNGRLCVEVMRRCSDGRG